MSHLLEELEGSPDDVYDEEYEEDYNVIHDEEQEEEEVPQVDLLSLAKGPKQKPKKQKNTPKKKQKEITIDLTPKKNIQYADDSIFEQYQQMANPQHENKSNKMLDQVDFRLNVREYTKLHYDPIHVKQITIMKVNPKWVEKKTELVKKMEELSKNRPRKVTEDDIEKHLIVDEDGTAIPKFNRSVSKLHHDVEDEQYASTNLSSILKRSYFATATYGEKIYMMGGYNGKAISGDLICFDTKEESFTVYYDLHTLSTPVQSRIHIHDEFRPQQLPALSNHKMVTLGDGLLIFGGTTKFKRIARYYYNTDFRTTHQIPTPDEMLLYYVGNIYNEEQIHLGVKKNVTAQYSSDVLTVYLNPARAVGQMTSIPRRKDFTATSVTDGVIYVFGGRTESNNIGLSDLYEVQMTSLSDTYNCRKIVPPKSHSLRESSMQWPRGRYGHSAINCNGNLLIFGGQDGTHYLCDLFLFNTSNDTWQEIITEGAVPHPMSFHAAFTPNNQTMLVYGGMNNKTVFDNFYRLDIGAKKWHSIKVMGHGHSLKSDPREMQIPLFGHSCVMAGGRMFRLGGTNGKQFVSTASTLNELADQGQPILLCKYLLEKKQEGLMADITFRCKDNDHDKFVEIKAHRAIVTARCSYLKERVQEALEQVQATSEDDYYVPELSGPEMIYLDVPEYPAVVVDAFIHFLYSGEIHLEGADNLNKLINLAETWSPDRHAPMLRQLCSGESFYLDTTDLVLHQLEEDFSQLINSELHSDLMLRIGDDLMPAHKIILCRSSFFRSMLLSGMQESTAAEIELEFNQEVVLEILQFLYTDRIEVSPSNCIGVLVYSSMLGLAEVSNYCRNMAGNLLADDNVFSVLSVAEMYFDLSLRRHCVKYLQQHYEDLKNAKEFEDLDDELKESLASYVAKKQKQQQKKEKQIKN
jgi:hypothetical protein